MVTRAWRAGVAKLAAVDAKSDAADIRAKANRAIGRSAHVDVADRNVDANIVDDRNPNVPFRRAVFGTAPDRESTGFGNRYGAPCRPCLEGPSDRVARFDDHANVRDASIEREGVAGGKATGRRTGRRAGGRRVR